MLSDSRNKSLCSLYMSEQIGRYTSLEQKLPATFPIQGNLTRKTAVLFSLLVHFRFFDASSIRYVLCILLLGAQCSSVDPSFPLFLCVFCSYVSSAPTVLCPLSPLFLFAFFASSSSLSTFPVCLLFLCPLFPTVPLCYNVPLFLCAHSSSMPSVP